MALPFADIERRAADVDRARTLTEGDFLEFGFYDDSEEAEAIVRILRREEWPVGLQTQLDPARYLRQRGWS
jgi:hypothetical protein